MKKDRTATDDMLKDKEQQNQTPLEEREERFRTLNRIITEMMYLRHPGEIHKFISDFLHSLYPDTIILYVSIDEHRNEARLENIAGLRNDLFLTISKLTGYNPIGRNYTLTPEHVKLYKTGEFIEYSCGLVEFAAFGPLLAQSIEKLIGLNSIQGIGMNKDENILAAILFLSFNGKTLTEGSFIEMFVKQAGIVLYKRMAEIALKESEEKYKNIIEKLNDVYYRTDTEGRLVMVSPSALATFGYSDMEELIGFPLEKLYPEPIERKRFTDLLRKTGTIKKYRTTLLRKDGTKIFVEISSNILLTESGEYIGVEGIVRDISDRKRAEARLLESEKRFKQAFDSASVGMAIVSLAGKFQKANRSLCEMLGYSAEELNEKSFQEFTHNDDLETDLNFVAEILDGKREMYQMEKRYFHKNGDIIWCLLSVSMVSDSEGSPQYFISQIVNINELKKTEEILKKRELQLKKLNSTKDRLFSIIGHDLRSPFNSILGLSELICENIDKYDNEKSRSFLNEIGNSSKHALVLLDNLLAWAKSQTGENDFNPRQLSLQPVVMEVLESMASAAKIKKISLSFFESYDNVLYADLNMLKTVLRNLIQNAIKFTATGGAIKIYAIPADDNIRISVSDNGTGMNVDTLKKLFTFTGNVTAYGTANEKGSGLGLILCREFVERHGGTISAESIEGNGSRFTFTMPGGKR